ncbi:MAG: PA2779 family protein [Bryobacterales bacterium]|nr:PA2779 family protein [Bryobacterales bacterium]
MRNAVVWVLSAVVPAMTTYAAENHAVPLSELHRQMISASEARQARLAGVREFFSRERVQKALRTVKMDSEQVKQAVALLNDDELARLAARADKAQADLAAGALNNQQLTYIVIALATAVIILVIVAR